MSGTMRHSYVSVRKIITRKIVVSIVRESTPHGTGQPAFVHLETANGVRRNGRVFVKMIITAQTVITVRESILNGMMETIGVFVHYRTALGIKIKTCVNV